MQQGLPEMRRPAIHQHDLRETGASERFRQSRGEPKAANPTADNHDAMRCRLRRLCRLLPLPPVLRGRGSLLIDCSHDPYPPEVIFAEPAKTSRGYVRYSFASSVRASIESAETAAQFNVSAQYIGFHLC